MKLIKLTLMGSTLKDDKTLLLNSSHISSVTEEEANNASRSVICFVTMVSGEKFTVRDTANYIMLKANQE